ncbi:FAD-dependent monooxygenase [Nostoc linckia FACHB-391]|uniref:FAD-dependent monooxygenase n=3 Tax=Nostoc TaxID=1177 RepID=A0ABR8IEW4_9NOSO|nr:FAD-dependent monooxygenase [Nostoc linckia]MBD2564547.1 FAD-dependent monooxygenase [Nostoc linckia FACHB-391]MBD2650101.1 FAD-dependent monooxygenase [Nostoc foliaceum FACHB-393]
MFNSTMTQLNERHALVIGGSIAGLLAAQVLTKYFNRVTIIERDHLSAQPEQRPGVPQAHHLHVLLKRGLDILEQLFPGIQTELAASGAVAINASADYLWYGLGGWTPRFNSDLNVYSLSRNLLEWIIRRRLATNNRVVFVQAAIVTGLLSNPNKTQVTGVQVRRKFDERQDSSPRQTDFTADLVVDASGRNSLAPRWLEAMGYTPPKETVINSFLGYASRLYELPENFQTDWQGALVTAKAPGTRSGGMFAIEGNRWIVTLAGIGRDYPPTDEAGFLDFARSLRNPIIYEAIKDAQAISPVRAYHRTENRWLHYEKLSRLPSGFVVIGDAVCAFNPVYGQGMTTAALGALTLDESLSKQLSRHADGNLVGLSQSFQKQLSKIIAVPWLMATGEDFRWHTTVGGRPNWMTQLMQYYLDQMLLLAAQSPDIHKLFLEVMHLLKPPSVFLHPSVLRQVLQRIIKKSDQNWNRSGDNLLVDQ